MDDKKNNSGGASMMQGMQMQQTVQLELKKWQVYLVAILLGMSVLSVGVPGTIQLLKGGYVGLSMQKSTDELAVAINRLTDQTKTVTDIVYDHEKRISISEVKVERNIKELDEVKKELYSIKDRVSK